LNLGHHHDAATIENTMKKSETQTVSEPAFQALNPAEQWFHRRGWDPFAFQRDAWQAYLEGRSGLIHAPTGIGKTYAAWFGSVLEWMQAHPQEDKGADGSTPPLRVLWITPLRALATDIQAALQGVIDDLALPWTVACRTGDTAASVKRRQKKQLPTTLITTPESLHLLLSYPGVRERSRRLRLVVVDEWHELMGSKRGVQVELALASLRAWHADLRVWGLSATIGNTDTALEVLLGDRSKRGIAIRGTAPKTVEVAAIIPAAIERFPWAGHLGLSLLPQVIDTIASAASTLVFTNTRAQTEIWFQALLEARPDWQGRLAMHHGSLDRKERETVEKALQNGQLLGVVCTSSLDLGVDFTPVDQVIQIGSPKGIARLIQRAGRSGHRPGEVSRVVCVPTNALELIEVAAARRSIGRNRIEPRQPIARPLDVLAQYLVTAALGDGFRPGAMFRNVKRTYAFRDLSRPEFDWVLDFVSTGGASLSAYPEYKKIVMQGGICTAGDKTIAARHRMNIGTITSDTAVLVKFVNGRRLGLVEEQFVARLKRGDAFVFAGRLLEYVRMKDMTLWVRRSRSRRGPIPQWIGGRMPLSTELGQAVRAVLARAGRGKVDEPEMTALAPILAVQARWSIIPGQKELLIESCKSREGHHLFLFPFEGRLVNEGLGALLAYRLSRLSPRTLTIAANDYGLELLSDQEIPLTPFKNRRLFYTDTLLEDIFASVNAAEMGRRQFREIARVAGLVFQGYPGRRKSGAQIQASSSLLYNVFQRYEPDNRLLAQASREVLARQLDYRRLQRCLERISRTTIRCIATGQFTPLAFPIMVNRLRARVSSEKLADRVRRMQVRLEKKAST
jgi:ATP-dependent Lhr-like helicase